MKQEIHIYPTKAELVQATVEMIAATVTRAEQERGRCALALAGGNTPREVYRALAHEPFQSRIDWNALHLFWGDERMVPPDHEESNFRMVQEALLMHVPLPAGNVHRLKGEISPEQAAREYQEDLQSFFGGRATQFDLVLLGVGEDGHTASLFPETEVLQEMTKPAAAVFVPKLGKWRVTLTLPVLNAAREVMFLVAGKSKAEMVENLLKLEKPEVKWPASLIRPENGVLRWLLDAEAAVAGIA